MSLLITSNIVADEFAEEIRIKLHRNLSNPNSEHYQKIFKVWTGSSVKGYYCTCNKFKEIITNLPITTKANLKIHAINILGQINSDNLVQVINAAPNNTTMK